MEDTVNYSETSISPAALAGVQPEFDGKPRLDFRWEVLAPPTEEMWAAMRKASASAGMASFHQDPTVHELNEFVAELTGHERAMFLPTTTACITLAWQALGITGTQVIMEERCHHYWVERLHFAATAGATAVLIRGDKFGAMSLDDIEAAVTRSYGGTVETGLISIENTHNFCGGTCLTAEYTNAVADLARRYGIALFVDGARIFNSAVAQGVPIQALAGPADAVAISLGKGLAAPMGAMLCGSAELLAKAELLARRTGVFSIHKAGIMAAAGLVGLRTMLPRLADDHARARRLAERLVQLDGIAVDLETVQTNFVRVETEASRRTASDLAHRMSRHGLAVHVVAPYAFKMVPSYTTTDQEIEEAVAIVIAVLDEVA